MRAIPFSQMQPMRALKELLWIAAVALLAALLTFFFHPKAPALYELTSPLENEITLGEARQLDGEVVWIDARSDRVFANSHLEGALLLNQENWADLLWQHRDVIEGIEGAAVIVYCDGKRCKRSGEIAERLRSELGLEPVYVLKGDWQEW